MPIRHLFVPMLLAVVLAGTASPAYTAAAWPERVLITNDNGIHDPRIRALAKAFATHGDTWLVAPNADRSGSSNLVSVRLEHLALTAVRLEKSGHLTTYSVAGYPADCVALGLNGLLRDTPPDLVVSGINGGPNLGMRDWFGSGTIGAARLAALAGVPAIAVSGLDDDDADMVDKVVNWVVAFAHSPIVRNLKPGEYLTVAIPTVAADKIRGIRIAPRTPSAPGLFAFHRVAQARHDGELAEVWAVKGTGKHPAPLAGSDAALYREGYIVVTPMRVGEDDTAAIPGLRREAGAIPRWPATPDRPEAR
jgi:5'-nucleotidase